MTEIPFEPGLIVRVKYYDEYPNFWDEDGEMGKYMNKIVIIKAKAETYDHKNCLLIKEDSKKNEYGGYGFYWRDIDFQKVNTPWTKK